VNSSDDNGSDTSTDKHKEGEREIKQIAESFTDTLDMIKGSIIRESGLSKG
jgi:hypothetical protein